VSGLVVAAVDAPRMRERARVRGALREAGAIELAGVRITLC
jgi:hypothetical protein